MGILIIEVLHKPLTSPANQFIKTCSIELTFQYKIPSAPIFKPFGLFCEPAFRISTRSFISHTRVWIEVRRPCKRHCNLVSFGTVKGILAPISIRTYISPISIGHMAIVYRIQAIDLRSERWALGLGHTPKNKKLKNSEPVSLSA